MDSNKMTKHQSVNPQSKGLSKFNSPTFSAKKYCELLFLPLIILVILLGLIIVSLTIINKQMKKELILIKQTQTNLIKPNSIPLQTPTKEPDQILQTDKITKQDINCETAQEIFKQSNEYHEFDALVEKSEIQGKCKFINNSINYSLLFDEGWTVGVSGAMSSNAVKFTNNKIKGVGDDLNSTIFVREIATDNSPFDLEDADSIMISSFGEYPLLDYEHEDILSNNIFNINNIKVLEITSSSKTTPRTGNSTDYEKRFIFLNQKDRTVYIFSLNSYTVTFDNPESLETVESVREIISSIELI